MSGGAPDPAAAMNAALDLGREQLADEARGWGERIRTVLALVAASEQAEKAGVPQFLHLEIAGSWQLSQSTAHRLMVEADRFDTALPRTLELLGTGALLRQQAWTVLHRTTHCPPEIARQVEAQVLSEPDVLSLCPADLGKRVDTAVLQIEAKQADSAAAEQRHADAVAERRTFVQPQQDGMGLAAAVLPAEKAIAWQSALDALERRERRADKAAGIQRTADQRRADIFAALPAMVLTALRAADTARGETAAGEGQLDLGFAAFANVPWTFSPDQVAATVILNVHVPVSTVLDLTCEPGSIDRYGPISAAHTRLLRPRAVRRVMADSTSGRPIAIDDHPTPAEQDPAAARQQIQDMLRPAVIRDLDEPQHDPSARLARLIDLRDLHCSGPGCSHSRCDRDHHDPHPAGPTSARNLHLLSRRCHQAKHHGWTLVRHPDGSVTWTSPIHRNYPRPSPHRPPRLVDLYAEPPPIRPAPRARTPWWAEEPDDHEPAAPSGAAAADGVSTAPPPAPDDDLPPF